MLIEPVNRVNLVKLNSVNSSVRCLPFLFLYRCQMGLPAYANIQADVCSDGWFPMYCRNPGG